MPRELALGSDSPPRARLVHAITRSSGSSNSTVLTDDGKLQVAELGAAVESCQPQSD